MPQHSQRAVGKGGHPMWQVAVLWGPPELGEGIHLAGTPPNRLAVQSQAGPRSPALLAPQSLMKGDAHEYVGSTGPKDKTVYGFHFISSHRRG